MVGIVSGFLKRLEMMPFSSESIEMKRRSHIPDLDLPGLLVARSYSRGILLT